MMRGFTMVELVIVILLLGIVSVSAMSRFASQSTFDERGYADEARGAFTHAQRMAGTGGCHLRVQTDAAGITLSRWPTCTPADHSVASTPIAHPDNQGTFVRPAPDGIAVSTLDIYFDGRGRPWSTATQTLITVAATITVGSRTLWVEPETGYVHD